MMIFDVLKLKLELNLPFVSMCCSGDTDGDVSV